jgi:hypothetical protein
MLSNINRNPIPDKKPTLAGSQAILPCSSAISIAGINNDQIDAAIITPEANPNNSFWMEGLISFFTKKTIDAPKVVPKKGIIKPIIASFM